MKRENYDVVVIGSGMGGMCAAALLTQEGYKTLVVERLPRIGGRFSTIESRGFKLTTGAIVIELGGLIEQIFNGIGAKFEVHPVPSFHWRIGREDFELPEKGGLRALISLAGGNERETDKVMSAIKRGLTWQEPSNSISFRDWLLQYTSDDKILQIFWGLITTRIGTNDHELPAGEFFHFLRLPRPGDAGVPPEGNLALMESLAGAIEAKGSQVWTSCPARQIIVADGMVKGVIIQKDGHETEVVARAVVSNAGPKSTVELAGNDKFDVGYLKQLRENLRPVPTFCIQAASDRPLVECPTLILPEARTVNLITCPTLICPDLAPKGKHLLVAVGAPRSSLPPYDFSQEKELNIQDLRDNLPGFDEHAQLLVASYFRGEWPGAHSWSGYDLPQKTPIVNLYNVGDGVKPGGWNGLRASAESARIVVEEIKKYFELREMYPVYVTSHFLYLARGVSLEAFKASYLCDNGRNNL